MRVRFRLAVMLAVAAAVSLVACERAAEPGGDAAVADAAPAVSGSPSDAPSTEIDATQVVDRAPVAGAAPDFDVKAFAGTFAAEGANLRLATDGTYAFTVHAASADADLETTGTWTVEAAGTELLLDPDSKGDPDQRFTIASSDELVAVLGGRVLRRDGA